MGKDTNGNESGERMVFGWNTVLWRSGVCTGKDTGIKQTGRVIVGLLLVKNKPGYGQKKRADTPKMKSESQVVVDVRSISQSPRRLRAKYTHRTNQRFVLRIFRPAGSYLCQKWQLVRKRMPMHPLTNNMAKFILSKTRRECLSEEIHLFK